MSVIDAADLFSMRDQRRIPVLLPKNVTHTTGHAVRRALHSDNDPYQDTQPRSVHFLSRLERIADSACALKIKSFELDFKALEKLAEEMTSQWTELREFSIPRQLLSQELAQIARLFPKLWGISFYALGDMQVMIDDLAQFTHMAEVTLNFQGKHIGSEDSQLLITALGTSWNYLNLNNLSGYESLDGKKPLLVAQAKGYGVEYGNGCSDIALSSPAIHKKEVSQREASA